MFKVICPLERRDGGKYWMRLGSAFTNKDDSINVYLDAVPTTKEFTLQLRELSEEELRERAEKRASYSTRTNANHIPQVATAVHDNQLPF